MIRKETIEVDYPLSYFTSKIIRPTNVSLLTNLGNLKVPLSINSILDLFGWLSKKNISKGGRQTEGSPEISAQINGDNTSEDKITVSKSSTQQYKSALKWWY